MVAISNLFAPRSGELQERQDEKDDTEHDEHSNRVEPPPAPSQLPDIFGGYPIDPPLGYTGPSGVLPRVRPDRDFVPMEDRWRLGFPTWDRADYTPDNPKTRDYPYQLGRWWDPFNQNVLKGDYPIIGQHTFLNLTATSITLGDTRQTPIGTTPFESALRARHDGSVISDCSARRPTDDLHDGR